MNPIIKPYQSACTGCALGHPANFTNQSTSAALQLRQIPAPLASSANRQRLDHAAVSLPASHIQGFQAQQPRRTRGPSVHPPSLYASRPALALLQVLVEGSTDVICVVAKVCPPLVLYYFYECSVLLLT